MFSVEQARKLLDSINIDSIVGLRDRALIAVMVYSFARVGATVGMQVEDYFESRWRSWYRLHEKGGKCHEVPAHHNAEAYVDAYPAAATPVGATKAEVRRRVHSTAHWKCSSRDWKRTTSSVGHAHFGAHRDYQSLNERLELLPATCWMPSWL